MTSRLRVSMPYRVTPPAWWRAKHAETRRQMSRAAQLQQFEHYAERIGDRPTRARERRTA